MNFVYTFICARKTQYQGFKYFLNSGSQTNILVTHTPSTLQNSSNL
jgi:hypothetical protein